MNNETRHRLKGTPPAEENRVVNLTQRREALTRMGKFAAYAAPFTVLALTNKAEAATGHGPGKGANGGPGKH